MILQIFQITLSALLLLSVHQAHAQSVEQILEQAFAANAADNFQVELSLATTSSQQKKSQMRLSVLGKMNKDRNFSLLIFFREPVGSRGMKLLVLPKKIKTPQVYLYMPAYEKYFELTGEDMNMKIGDSDMTLSDFIAINPWEGKHQLLGTDRWGTEVCHLVESRLSWETGKRLTKISKESLLSVQTEQFDKNNTLIKTIEAKEFWQIGSNNRIKSFSIVGHQTNTHTDIEVLSGDTLTVIPPRIFAPETLTYTYPQVMNLIAEEL